MVASVKDDNQASEVALCGPIVYYEMSTRFFKGACTLHKCGVARYSVPQISPRASTVGTITTKSLKANYRIFLNLNNRPSDFWKIFGQYSQNL
jgi:hypothetical protein